MQSGKKKKNKKEVKAKVVPAVPPAKEKQEDQSSGFDFGGLPARDLKKNLGCG